jgi:hypothetical protein
MEAQRPSTFIHLLISFSVLDEGGWLTPRSGHFTTEKEIRYPFTRGWVSPTVCMDGYGKSRAPTRIRSQDRPARSKVFGLQLLNHTKLNIIY